LITLGGDKQTMICEKRDNVSTVRAHITDKYLWVEKNHARFEKQSDQIPYSVIKGLRLFTECTLLLFLISCMQAGEGVSFDIDYQSQDQWVYRSELYQNRSTTFDEKSYKNEQTITAELVGESIPDDPSALSLTIKNIHSTSSDTSASAMLQNVGIPTDDSIPFIISLKDGFSIDSLSKLSQNFNRMENAQFYRHLMKLVPQLPSKKIVPGFFWERQSEIPLQTSYQDGYAELYQYYKFDSLSENKSTAFISWEFNYVVQLSYEEESINNLPVPLRGHGRGRARISLNKKVLEFAEVLFWVVPKEGNPFELSLEEKATIELKS